MGSEILEIGPLELKIPLREYATEELIADFTDRLLIVQAGSDGIYCCHRMWLQKKGKHLISHRYNLLPLLRSRPGGVQRELVV